MNNKYLFSMNLQLLASDNGENEETIEQKVIKMQEKLLLMDEIIKENNSLKANNEMLFNKNQEYFLKITGKNDKENNDKEINEYEEYVGKEFYDNLTNKEKKLLETILEGDD